MSKELSRKFDLVLKGGHVIDPKNSIDGQMDVAISDGKIAEVTEHIPVEAASHRIDVSGLLVAPGLIDIHAYVNRQHHGPGFS